MRGSTSSSDEHGDADEQRRRAASGRGLSKNARTSVEERVGVVEKPNSFGSWPTMIVMREAVHVADLHLLGEQVGDEPELAQAEADLGEADEHRQHAGQRDRRRRRRRRPAAA